MYSFDTLDALAIVEALSEYEYNLLSTKGNRLTKLGFHSRRNLVGYSYDLLIPQLREKQVLCVCALGPVGDIAMQISNPFSWGLVEQSIDSGLLKYRVYCAVHAYRQYFSHDPVRLIELNRAAFRKAWKP